MDGSKTVKFVYFLLKTSSTLNEKNIDLMLYN